MHRKLVNSSMEGSKIKKGVKNKNFLINSKCIQILSKTNGNDYAVSSYHWGISRP